jgi:hypothetical protein
VFSKAYDAIDNAIPPNSEIKSMFSEATDKVGDFFSGLLSPVKSIPNKQQAARAVRQSSSPASQELGFLSSMFESGGDPGAVGHDRTGGFSYGTYQLASNTGTLGKFIEFTKQENERIYSNLVTAGGEEAAKQGSAVFQKAWKDMSSDPEFVRAQEAFMRKTHFEPQAESLKREFGFDINSRSRTAQSALFSTTTQHGARGTKNIMRRVLGGEDPSTISDQEFINRLYAERGRVDDSGTAAYFPSSTKQVQQSVLRRFRNEKTMALSSLQQEQMSQPLAVSATQLRETTPQVMSPVPSVLKQDTPSESPKQPRATSIPMSQPLTDIRTQASVGSTPMWSQQPELLIINSLGMLT